MYALKLPPDLVSRLYRLREQHRLGPIRKQILIAVRHYLDDMEAEYGAGPEPSGSPPPEPPRPGLAARKHP